MSKACSAFTKFIDSPKEKNEYSVFDADLCFMKSVAADIRQIPATKKIALKKSLFTF